MRSSFAVSSTLALDLARGTPWHFSGKPMFCAHVHVRIEREELEHESDVPLRRARNVTSSPSSRIRPEVGSSRPAIMRKVVVLPQPEGPSMTKNSPSSIVKVEPRTAMKLAERLAQIFEADLGHGAHPENG